MNFLRSLKAIRRNFFKKKSKEIKEKWEEWEIKKKKRDFPNFYHSSNYGEALPHKWFNVQRVREAAKIFENFYNTSRVTHKIPKKEA